MKKASRTTRTKVSAAPVQRTPAPDLRAAVVAILVLGGVLRLLAARGELWLDEIWSLQLGRLTSSWLGVFTTIHHDNNHHLNTLYLTWIPDTGNWVLYRLHSIVAGIGTIGLAGVIARRTTGPIAMLHAMLLVATSFFLTLYGSEARGYALAAMFSFAAVLSSARFLETGHARWAAAFWICAVFGFLSHLTFLQALLGIIIWTAFRTIRSAGMREWLKLLVLHVPPIAALAVLYWVDLRYIVIGGGPIVAVDEVVTRALSLTLGGPESGSVTGPVAALTLSALLASILLLWRSGSDLWVLVTAVTLVAPAVTVLSIRADLLYERYFLVPSAFAVLSYSFLTGAAWARSRAWGGVMILAFLAPNLLHTSRLISFGRSNYIGAMSYMSGHAVQHPVTVGGDHDFRQGRLVEFYRPFVPAAQDMEYHTPPEWAMAGPEWMLVHSFDSDFVPSQSLSLTGGRRYRLAEWYPYAGLSGWHLAVYHNALAIGP